MGTCKITSTNSNVDGCVSMDVLTTPLYINRSALSATRPEMYNYNGEELYLVEVPYEALNISGIEYAGKKGGKVLTLAKMEKNIAAGGKSYKINPAYGIDTSKIESFTFKVEGGESMTVIPQEEQYSFYSKRGVTRILGKLEHAGSAWDFYSILKFGMDPGDKSEPLPVPGPLGVLNLPIKDYLRDLDETIDAYAKKVLEDAKKVSIEAVKKVVNSNIHQEMGYRLIGLLNESVKDILNGKIKTEEEMIAAHNATDLYNCQVLYRITENRAGYDIAVIETFFFQID